jgi:hypothetical protein
MTHSKHTGLANRPNEGTLWRAIDKPFSGDPALTRGSPLRRFWGDTALIGPRSRALVFVRLQ